MSLGLILLIISNRARRRVQWSLWRLRLWLWPRRSWPPRHYLDHPSRLASHGLGSSRDNSLGVYESGSLEKHDDWGCMNRDHWRSTMKVTLGLGPLAALLLAGIAWSTPVQAQWAPLTIPSLR